MARTIRFHELGDPEVLRFEELPVRDPGPGEVRLRIDATRPARGRAAAAIVDDGVGELARRTRLRRFARSTARQAGPSGTPLNSMF